MDRAPVLPTLPVGRLDPAAAPAAIAAWASSAPMRTLADASGWTWPDAASPAELLAGLVERSADWDFRGRRAKEVGSPVERGSMPTGAALVNGREVPDDLIVTAAAELGLVDGVPPRPAEPFTHLVILSGAVRACVNRARYAAGLLRAGVIEAGTVVALTAHRPLGAAEQDQAAELGLGSPDSESAALVEAVRQAFGLGAPELDESAPDEGPQEARLARTAAYRWPGVEVFSVPATGGRATTADQLVWWRDRAGLGPADRVLLVTTQIYVPYQHLVAIRLLGLPTGTAVWTTGVDAETAAVPTRQFTGADYLQEVRSALTAAGQVVGGS